MTGKSISETNEQQEEKIMCVNYDTIMIYDFIHKL